MLLDQHMSLLFVLSSVPVQSLSGGRIQHDERQKSGVAEGWDASWLPVLDSWHAMPWGTWGKLLDSLGSERPIVRVVATT